ncbi:hypothetical protein Avbf_16694 [Armadillidium vulgare]|nr:hypothetical protein Avbf_16694 [Armadillidium vulgare]
MSPKKKNNQLWRVILRQNQKKTNFSFNSIHKWTIYITGLLETFIFNGCVFGWGPMVYILKNENVFLDLCDDQVKMNSTNETLLIYNETEEKEVALNGCPEQDKEFALIYTITILIYSIPSIILWIDRASCRLGRCKDNWILLLLWDIGSRFNNSR